MTYIHSFIMGQNFQFMLWAGDLPHIVRHTTQFQRLLRSGLNIWMHEVAFLGANFAMTIRHINSVPLK
jgi:hypothetical protein